MEEDLSVNPVLIALQRAPGLVAKVLQEEWQLACPSAYSLATAGVTNLFLESHLIKPAPEGNAEEWVSLNSRSLRRSGSLLVTGLGYEDNRSAEVLFEELFYLPGHDSGLRVLCVAAPLVGRMLRLERKPRDSQASLLAQNAHEDGLVGFKTAMECEAFLRSVCVQERGAEALQRADYHILQFNRSYVLVGQYMEHAQSKLRLMCQELQGEIARYVTKVDGKNVAAVELAASTYVLRGVHDKLFIFLATERQVVDRQITALCEQLQPLVTQAALGVQRECECDTSAAVQHLAQLPSKCAPLEKLACLMACHESIERAVQSNRSGGALTTDSLLPLQIYTLVQAAPRRITTEIAYIDTFFTRDLAASRHGYVYANFCAAIEFLTQQCRDPTLLEELRAAAPAATTPTPAPTAPAASPASVAALAPPPTPQCAAPAPPTPIPSPASDGSGSSGRPPWGETEAVEAGPYRDLYDEWFKLADNDRDGKVAGPEAVHFFSRSGLETAVLAKVWAAVDHQQRGFLSRATFERMMRAISHSQQTQAVPSAATIHNLEPTTPPPRMVGLPPSSPSASPAAATPTAPPATSTPHQPAVPAVVATRTPAPNRPQRPLFGGGADVRPRSPIGRHASGGGDYDTASPEPSARAAFIPTTISPAPPQLHVSPAVDRLRMGRSVDPPAATTLHPLASVSDDDDGWGPSQEGSGVEGAEAAGGAGEEDVDAAMMHQVQQRLQKMLPGSGGGGTHNGERTYPRAAPPRVGPIFTVPVKGASAAIARGRGTVQNLASQFEAPREHQGEGSREPMGGFLSSLKANKSDISSSRYRGQS